QPPKKKVEAGKKPAKPRTPTLINGLTKDEMSKEQLEEHIVRLREELNREREERNYFQLERDKINSFWEVTVRKQEEVEAELKKVDKDMEEAEARHQLDVKVYKQKIKHLQHEHLNVITELKSDSLAASEVLEKEQEQLEAELRKTIRVDIQELNIEHAKRELLFCVTAGVETTALCEKRMHVLQQDLDNVTKSQISDRESHWDSHIAALTKDHSKIYSNTEEFVAAMNTDLKRKSLKDLKSEHEILEQKFSKLQLERDELCKAFTESAEEEQHKDMEVEKKLQALTESQERTEAQLSVVLSASNTDRTALSLITKKIEVVFYNLLYHCTFKIHCHRPDITINTPEYCFLPLTAPGKALSTNQIFLHHMQ
uniref:Dynein regulatory complex subunit 4 n=1 Tax=Amphilophus citrinellus TaxID=61819 RepID=A0A3Q0QYC7_AMPCI